MQMIYILLKSYYQKNSKIMRLKYILTFVIIIVAFIPVLAQPGGPPATPIDGGLSALLVAGGLYGCKKIKDYKKSK